MFVGDGIFGGREATKLSELLFKQKAKDLFMRRQRAGRVALMVRRSWKELGLFEELQVKESG